MPLLTELGNHFTRIHFYKDVAPSGAARRFPFLRVSLYMLVCCFTVKNRVAFLLCLDTAMLLLVCVLECINFTGLEWHQWLGFAFCPVVLLHVVMQWQWFITQFRRVLTPGAWRVRVNAGLNLLLLVLMAAVLFSGGFVSAQARGVAGRKFWAGAHLERGAWVVELRLGGAGGFASGAELGLDDRRAAPSSARATGAGDRRRSAAVAQRPAAVSWRAGVRRTGRVRIASGNRFGQRSARSLGRAVAVLLVASVGAGAVYFSMKAMLLPKMRARMERERVVTAGATGREGNQPAPRPTEPARNRLAPRNRPAEPERAGHRGHVRFTVFVAVIGRYVFRLRL